MGRVPWVCRCWDKPVPSWPSEIALQDADQILQAITEAGALRSPWFPLMEGWRVSDWHENIFQRNETQQPNEPVHEMKHNQSQCPFVATYIIFSIFPLAAVRGIREVCSTWSRRSLRLSTKKNPKRAQTGYQMTWGCIKILNPPGLSECSDEHSNFVQFSVYSPFRDRPRSC